MKKEETQYVCSCGDTSFEIFDTYIKCSKCGQGYYYYQGFLVKPPVFNGRRNSYHRKEKTK